MVRLLSVGVVIDSVGWLFCSCVRVQEYVLNVLHFRGICWVINMLQVVVPICYQMGAV